MSWPYGTLPQEEIERLKKLSYDDMPLEDKLKWISYLFGTVELPNEENTTMRNALPKAEEAIDELDKVFEMIWFLAKEQPLLRAACQIFKKYHRKIGHARKFKYKIERMKKRQQNRRPQKKFVKKRY